MIRALALAFILLQFPLVAAEAADFGPATPVGGVTPLTTLALPLSSPHLIPLKKLADSVSTLGMGEPVHGSHEFQVSRTLFIKSLIQDLGYRTVVFEAPWIPSRQANEYLHSCRGVSKTALQNLTFPAWFDTATLELMEWVCEFNKNHHSDPVSFYGFDIQNPKHLDRQLIQDFFDSYDPAFGGSIRSGLVQCISWVKQDIQSISKPAVEICEQVLSKIQSRIAAQRLRYVSLSSDEAVFSLELSTESMAAFQYEVLFYPTARGTEARDTGMFRLYKKLRNYCFPASKTILYAHNWHIAKKTAGGNYPPENRGVDSIGSLLARELGSMYGAVGLIGYDVRVNPAVAGTADSLPIPTSENSVERALHEAGLAYAFVDGTGSFLGLGKFHDLQDADSGRRVPCEHYNLLFYSDDSGPLICPSGMSCAIPW